MTPKQVALVQDSFAKVADHNDPITGQGLSIAARDVGIVSDILLSTKDWDHIDFEAYVDERRERMRRLRITAGDQDTGRIWRGSQAASGQSKQQNARTPTFSVARCSRRPRSDCLLRLTRRKRSRS